MTPDQRHFSTFGRLAQRLSRIGSPVFVTWLERLFPPAAEQLDWAGDADWARLQQEPLRARALLRASAVCLLLLLLWASLANVDEVTRGEAKVVPTRQVQIVQSFDGGVVEALLVHEGQIVSAGEPLLRIDSTRFESSMQESRVGRLALEAKALRLQALTSSSAFNPSAQLMKDAPDVVEAERRLFDSRRSEISAQVSIARSQLLQRQQELNEVRARRDQAARSFDLTQQEYNATRPLVQSGAVSEVEILRLERDMARLRGEREQSGAQISRVQESIAEASRKIEEVELTARNQMRNELADTMSKISSLSESGRALVDKVKSAEIKSPVRGTVKRMLVNTVGGVVLPGKDVIEIVPLDEALILEARIKPQDIGFLHPGQDALVKFNAYDFSVYGGLQAEVEQIGADSTTDEKGNAYYLVRVRTHKTQLGEKLPIIPGMVAEVDILTGKKTVLAYLLKPVLQAKSRALSER